MGCRKLTYYPDREPKINTLSKELTTKISSQTLRSSYLFGFNGQEKDDEVAGTGNTNTAMFWEYDTRLGRRWNRDPVVKVWQSLYSTFSNNPLIFVDPIGNTDFYNLKGDKIGSNGVNNNEELIVLSRRTERQIIRDVKKDGIAALNAGQLKTTIPVPSDDVMNKFDKTLSNTGTKGTAEFGFVVGMKNGEQLASSVYEGTAGSPTTVPSFEPSIGSKEVGKNGATPSYSVRSHPNVMRYNKEGSMTFSLGIPSGKDINSSAPSKYADVVLGINAKDTFHTINTDEQKALANTGKWIERSDTDSKTISFYNEGGTVKTIKYSDFKSVVNKIKDRRNIASY